MRELILICLMMLLTGCADCDKNNCVEAPLPFEFSIIDRYSKADLVFTDHPRYHPDSIRLYYILDGEEIDLQLGIETGELDYTKFSNQILPYMSAANSIKDYYLELSHDDTDTLMLDVRQINFECCTVFQWAESYFNGRILKRSQVDYSVFLIEK